MSSPLSQAEAPWALAVFAAAVVFLVASMMLLSALLGQRHRERQTGRPYESGVAPTGSARIRFDVQFYLIAMFFVIFDLEAVFIMAWAIAFREAGWPGYIALVIFTAVLGVILFYLWRLGALQWGGSRLRRQAAP